MGILVWGKENWFWIKSEFFPGNLELSWKMYKQWKVTDSEKIWYENGRRGKISYHWEMGGAINVNKPSVTKSERITGYENIRLYI